MAEAFKIEEIEEKVILVGVSEQDGDDAEDSVAELAELVKTAGATVVGTMIQKRELIHPGTYIGSRKVAELKLLVEELGATLVFGTWKRACGTNHRTFTFCFVWILAEPLRWSPCGFKDTDKRKRKPVTSGFSGGGFCTTVSRDFHWSSRDCRTGHRTFDPPQNRGQSGTGAG